MIDFASPPDVVRAAAFGLALVFTFGALSIARRGERRVPRTLLYGLACLAAFALLARPRLLPPGAEDVAILWTVGADAPRARQELRQLRAVGRAAEVRRAPGASGADELEPLGRFRELADIAPSWRLLGPGFLPEEVLALPSGLRWAVDPAPAPTGLVDLHWPRSVSLGREVVVSGRTRRSPEAAPGAERWRLRGPGGVESETALDGDAGFRLTALPRAIGRLQLVLESLAVDSPTGAVPRLEATLDLTVDPPRFPRVRILAARPNPDAATLRRWLARRGAPVELEVDLSEGIRAEIASDEPEPGQEAVAGPGPVTVVFGDLPRRLATALPDGPVILVGEAALRAYRGDRPRPSEQDATSAVEPRSSGGARLGALSLGGQRLAKDEVAEPLWYDAQGAVLAGAVSRAPGSPLGVATLIESSYRYALRGEAGSYAALWSDLLEAASPVERSPHCWLPSGPIVDGDPLSVTCWRDPRGDGPLELALETPDGVSHALEPVVHPLDGDRFETRLWPRGEGWHRLSARQGERHAEVGFRARSRTEWAAWDAERRRRATADLVARSTAAPLDLRGLRPLPTGWLFALLLAALAVLWGVERSTS